MNWIKKLYFKQIALIVAFGIFIIGSVPSESMAYVVGANSVTAPVERTVDMDSIQRVLESRLVSEKLQQAGLTASEVRTRLDKLSDSELHQFASQVNSLYPGGDLGIIITLLVIVILVLILLKISDRKIIIK